MSSQTLDSVVETTEQTSDVESGDHDRFAHYVKKSKITEAQVTGLPVIALCGKVWVPTKSPDKFAVCPACKEIYDSIIGE